MKYLFYNKIIFLLLLEIILGATVVKSADFYVDPVNGSMTNDGSKSHPWSTFQEVWEQNKIRTGKWGKDGITVINPAGPVHTGDTIYLLSGYHGKLLMQGGVNDDWITVKAYPGATPEFHSFKIEYAANWIFDGLSISYSYGPKPITKPSTGSLFYVASHNYFGRSREIILKNSTLFSYMDNTGWTAQDWIAKAVNGISINYVEYVTIDNCKMFNLAFAVAFSSGQYNEIRNCLIDGMSGDGIRMAGTSYSKIEYNTIKNLRLVDANHPDMIQAWALADSGQPDWMDYGGQNPQKGVEIRGNILIANEDPNQPLASGAQGIGCFDGWYEDFVIENNLISSPTAHGISLYAAINCRIINNTVTSNPIRGVSAPIRVLPHKDRKLGGGHGNIVRNNICSAFADHSVYTNPAETIYGGVTEDHNIKSLTKAMSYDIFVNPEGFNYTLKPTATTAINTGSTELAPTMDLNKQPRNAQPDIGAYQYSTTRVPVSFRLTSKFQVE